MPTLTTNGLCHTYNGKSPAEIWKKTEIMDVFHEVFPTKHTIERFDGAGTVEGEKKSSDILRRPQNFKKDSQFF